MFSGQGSVTFALKRNRALAAIGAVLCASCVAPSASHQTNTVAPNTDSATVTLAGIARGSARSPAGSARRVVVPHAPLKDEAAYRALESGLVTEINRMRASPSAYASVLERRLAYYHDLVYREPGATVSLQTREGAAAVQEAIDVLRRTAPLPPLRLSQGMSRGARDHVLDSGPKGRLDHEGTDGSQSWDRVSRYGTWRRLINENMSFGPSNATDIVEELLIDDGVKDRGHRHNLLNPDIHVIGLSCGTHATYGVMCDFVQAADFIEADATSAKPQR